MQLLQNILIFVFFQITLEIEMAINIGINKNILN